MSDREKSVDELQAKAAFAVAKHAAERALGDALLGDEERAKRRTTEHALSRRKRSTRIALVAVGLLLVVGLVGLMLHYWYWALLLGFVGVGGLYGRHRWRARRASRERKPEVAAAREAPAVKTRIAPEPRLAPAPAAEIDEASIDDDLAELKARMKK